MVIVQGHGPLRGHIFRDRDAGLAAVRLAGRSWHECCCVLLRRGNGRHDYRDRVALLQPHDVGGWQ